MIKNIYEVFDEFKQAVTIEEKIQVLRKNSSPPLLAVLKGTFDPSITFTVKRVPLYNPSDAPPGMGYATIYQEIKKMYLFQENNNRVAPGLTEDRKEQILIQTLEALEKREAEVFMNTLLKDQRIPDLTYENVKAAFPDLLP